MNFFYFFLDFFYFFIYNKDVDKKISICGN